MLTQILFEHGPEVLEIVKLEGMYIIAITELHVTEHIVHNVFVYVLIKKLRSHYESPTNCIFQRM